VSSYVGIVKRIKNHTVDLSSLYLKEGSSVLVSNKPNHVRALYERRLPDEDYWATYTANPTLENPEDVSPHDIIHITQPTGFCKVFINLDDQERECAEKDNGGKR